VDVVGNMALVKAFRAAGAERRRLSSIFKSEAARQCESWFFLEKTRIFHDLVLWAGAGAMLYWAISLWTAGELTPGDVVVISALTFRVLHGARDLALAGTGMSNDLAFIAETLATIGAPHQVQDAPDAKPLTAEQGMIEFRNVTFRHRSEQPLFEDFSLSIRAGERIGIAGHSGSGKSTLIGLLQRLYDPQHGQILIDGQPIQRVTQESLHAAVAVVPQDCTLLHRSILENIRYGRPEASDAEVMAAARAAHCDGFISGLPQGYETVVGERGATLSGGQRQRIAVARVLLSTAKIVLLDEATSAMDTVLERDVYRSLERVLRGKTVIVVAHRLATVANCDRIVVLDAGQIAEQGAPAELTTKHGAYAAFLRPQPAA
jgi:ATP-binding cassette subfamily B protein